jgi:hypothetical protein
MDPPGTGWTHSLHADQCGQCRALVTATDVLCPSCGCLLAAYTSPAGSQRPAWTASPVVVLPPSPTDQPATHSPIGDALRRAHASWPPAAPRLPVPGTGPETVIAKAVPAREPISARVGLGRGQRLARRTESAGRRPVEPAPAQYAPGTSLAGWLSTDTVAGTLLPIILLCLLIIGGAYLFSMIGAIAGFVLGIASFRLWK